MKVLPVTPPVGRAVEPDHVYWSKGFDVIEQTPEGSLGGYYRFFDFYDPVRVRIISDGRSKGLTNLEGVGGCLPSGFRKLVRHLRVQVLCPSALSALSAKIAGESPIEWWGSGPTKARVEVKFFVGSALRKTFSVRVGKLLHLPQPLDLMELEQFRVEIPLTGALYRFGPSRVRVELHGPLWAPSG